MLLVYNSSIVTGTNFSYRLVTGTNFSSYRLVTGTNFSYRLLVFLLINKCSNKFRRFFLFLTIFWVVFFLQTIESNALVLFILFFFA